MACRVLGATARAGLFGVMAVAVATIALVPAAGAEPGHPGSGAVGGQPGAPPAAGAAAPVPVQAAGPARQVLLINGGTASVSLAAGHPAASELGPVAVSPAARSGLAGAVMSLSLGGRRYEIPAGALPYFGHGLDPRLFDIATLLTRERQGRLPVRVSYHGHRPTIPGVTLTGSGGGTATGYLTASSARVFGAALDRRYAADRATGRYGTGGMFAGGTTIGVAGTAPASTAPARAAATDTLTIEGTNLAGKPDTGDVVLLFNVDNTRLVSPDKTAQAFQHGAATYHVPPGHYFAIGEFAPAHTIVTGPDRFVVLPQFTVAGNTTVTMRGAAANSKITMVTPRPATAATTDLWLLRTAKSGPPAAFEFFQLGAPEWVSPTHTAPTVGTLRTSVNEHLESPAGPAVPYEYTLSFTPAAGTIPQQHYVVAAKDLATIHETFHQPVRSTGNWAFNGSFPGTNPFAARQLFGFIEPAGPALKLPGRLTEYAGGGGSARMEWFGQYEPFSGLVYEPGEVRQLKPGDQLTENWGAAPLHTAANVLFTREPHLFGTTQPSADRSGNTLSLEVDPFDDNQPGHRLGVLIKQTPAGLSGSYRIDENGKKIAGGNAVTGTGPTTEFFTQATLGSAPSTVRFTLAVARTDARFPLSSSTRTVWQWRSVPVTGAQLPRGWSCTPFARARDCAVEPMMTLNYAVTGLTLQDTAPAGNQSVHVAAGHLAAATASAITRAAVSVSFDGGTTWQPAKITGSNGNYTASFTAKAGAMVTLRTTATDAAGGNITETITGAYQTAG